MILKPYIDYVMFRESYLKILFNISIDILSDKKLLNLNIERLLNNEFKTNR